MLKHKAYRFRLYPTKEQAILINKTIGCSRFVYNYFLNMWNEAYKETGKGLNYYQCSLQLPSLKKQTDKLWLKEVDSVALQSSLHNLANGFDRFFKEKNGHPHFKSKKKPVQSYTTKYTHNNIAILQNKIKLPKLGLVKFSNSRKVDGRILNATIRRNSTGKYFISILTEVEIFPLPKKDSSTGVDLGLKEFAILSNDKVYDNPKYFSALEKKLAKEQRILSRRLKKAQKDGKKLINAKNYQKQKIKVAHLHERIKNKRKDYLHKVSTEIIKKHDIIGIENLKVSGMLQNHRLAKAISEVSWSQFCTLLQYKADWYGKKIVVVARDFPSSQLCSECGYKNKDVKNLSVREWTCPICHTHHDRDLNASKNLKQEAERILASQTVGTTGIA